MAKNIQHEVSLKDLATKPAISPDLKALKEELSHLDTIIREIKEHVAPLTELLEAHAYRPEPHEIWAGHGELMDKGNDDNIHPVKKENEQSLRSFVKEMVKDKGGDKDDTNVAELPAVQAMDLLHNNNSATMQDESNGASIAEQPLTPFTDINDLIRPPAYLPELQQMTQGTNEMDSAGDIPMPPAAEIASIPATAFVSNIQQMKNDFMQGDSSGDTVAAMPAFLDQWATPQSAGTQEDPLALNTFLQHNHDVLHTHDLNIYGNSNNEGVGSATDYMASQMPLTNIEHQHTKNINDRTKKYTNNHVTISSGRHGTMHATQHGKHSASDIKKMVLSVIHDVASDSEIG